MENENHIVPKRYIETGGTEPNSKIMREIFDTNNIPLKIRINQKYWEKGQKPRYVIDEKARLFYSELGRLSIRFKMSLIVIAEKNLN